MGAAKFREQVALFGSCGRAWDAAPESLARDEASEEASRILERADRAGARVLASDDENYPVALHDLPDPPPVLFVIGTLALLDAPCIAIVGTRRATSYGERVTTELASALARAGVTIVSGMARGIDGAAHRAALNAGGATAAVLGTGVDVAYPVAHASLHAEIAARGLLLSEELPGDRASGGSFPKRNRLIAAIAQATLVVEAPHKSGALITANHALDLGRGVAAVPGPVDMPQSAGSNALLRDGAIVITDVADSLALARVSAPSQRTAAPTDPTLLALWNALEAPAPDLDALVSRSGLPARMCLTAVTALEVQGMIECALTGEIRRRGTLASGFER